MIQTDSKTVIGIVGPTGSGKDTVADYIGKKLNAPTFQMSQVIKEIAQERGLEPIRDNLVKLGNEISREKGHDYLAQVILSRIEKVGVVTGIRRLAVSKYFRDHSHFVLIAVEADPAIRFERVKARNKLGEAKTLPEFIETEIKQNSPPNDQRLFECIAEADYHVENNRALALVFEKIDKILTGEVLMA